MEYVLQKIVFKCDFLFFFFLLIQQPKPSVFHTKCKGVHLLIYLFTESGCFILKLSVSLSFNLENDYLKN